MPDLHHRGTEDTESFDERIGRRALKLQDMLSRCKDALAAGRQLKTDMDSYNENFNPDLKIELPGFDGELRYLETLEKNLETQLEEIL